MLTTKIWSFFQFPPRLDLAAASALPLLVLTMLLLWLQKWLLWRRGYTVVGGKSGTPRKVELGGWTWLAGLFRALHPLRHDRISLSCASEDSVDPQYLGAADLEHAHLPQFEFVLFELSSTRLAIWNTFIVGILTATVCTAMVVVISYLVARRAVAYASLLGVLAMAPIAVPGIVLGVGLFLAYANTTFHLYGTLWILLIAFLTLELPAGSQQLSAAFHGVHPSWRRQAASLAQRGCAVSGRSRRRCFEPASSRHGVSSSSAPSASCRRPSC